VHLSSPSIPVFTANVTHSIGATLFTSDIAAHVSQPFLNYCGPFFVQKIFKVSFSYQYEKQIVNFCLLLANFLLN